MDEPLAMRRKIADARHQVLGVADRLHSSPALDLVMTAFAAELEQQDALFEGIGLADIAHTIMLIEVGVIRRTRERRCSRFSCEVAAASPRLRSRSGVGRHVYEPRSVALGPYTHDGMARAGRARREATTTGYLVATRWRLLEMVGATIEAGRAIVDCAERHRESANAGLYLSSGRPTDHVRISDSVSSRTDARS